jgi:DNA-binding NarL/FixJ family response regulator
MNKATIGTVIVVEDDTFIRHAIESALNVSGFKVLASVSSAKDAITAFTNEAPELVLLDLDLGIGPTGIDLAYALRKLNPTVGIVFLTSFVDPRFADPSARPTPQGSRYLVKSEISNLSEITSILLQTKHKPFNQNINHMNKFETLTNMQIEVWKSVAAGLSSSEIAAQRGISEKAVEATIARIYAFLEMKRTPSTNPRVLLANAFAKLSGKT